MFLDDLTLRLREYIKSHDNDSFFIFFEMTNAKNNYELIESYLFPDACEYGNYKIFKELLKLDIDINYKDCDGRTPLFLSIMCGRVRIFQKLIKKGASPTPRALKFAVENFERKGMKETLEHIFQEKTISANAIIDEPILFTAINKRNLELCRYLLDKGVDPNVLYSNQTPCSLAIQLYDIEYLNLLLLYGAKVNLYCETNERGDEINPRPCILKTALSYFNPNIIKALINNGCSLNHIHGGESLISYATRLGYVSLKYLIDNGASINLSQWNNPLVISMRNDHFSCFCILLDSGIDVNAIYEPHPYTESIDGDFDRENKGRDILQIALRESPPYVIALINHGVTITKKHVKEAAEEDKFKTFILLDEERQRRNEEILLIILFAKKFLPQSKFFKDYLPLPLLRIILKYAEIPPILPPRGKEKILLKKFKTECIDFLE